MLRKWIVPSSALVAGVAGSYLAVKALENKSARRPSTGEHFPLTGRDTTTYERLSLNDVYHRYKIKTLDKKSQKDRVLGEGSYAHVIGCTEVTTGKSVALKVVKKAFTKAHDFEREVTALTTARIHPNVVQLLDVIDVPDADSWLLVTELLEGGELFDRILQRGAFSERAAAALITKVASSLSCLHRLGWTHNDVKPENLVYCTKDPDSEIKLIDFGMARRHPDASGYSPNDQKLASKDLGTTAYWSPEILDQTTRFTSDPRKIDAWTLGVLTYILLFGCHPFDRSGDASEEIVSQRIGQKAADGSIPSYISFDCFGPEYAISANAKRFLTALLECDPAKRMSVDEVLMHDWIIETLQSTDEDITDEPKATKIARKLRGERDAQAALAALLKVATEGSAARDAYYHSITPTSDQQQGEDNPLRNFKFELDKRRLMTFDGIVYDVGDATSGLYVVVKGRAQLEYPSAQHVEGESNGRTHMAVQLLGPGDLFGETAILEGRNFRNCRVHAVDGPIEAYFFSRGDVVAVLSGSMELKERLDELSARRYRLRAANALMTRAENDKSIGRTLNFAKGEKVFIKGEPANHIYLVKSGVVKSIVSEDPDKAKKSAEVVEEGPSSSLERALGPTSKRTRAADKVVIGEWGPGDVFGISALYGSPRFASAVAQTPVQVIEVTRENLERVLEQEPALRENLAQQFRTFKERSASIARKHTKRKSELAKKQRKTQESQAERNGSSTLSSGASIDATATSSRPQDDSTVVLKKGDVLFREGDSSDTGVFFVQEGIVHLLDSKGKIRYINSDGHTFGTESFVRGTPRRYTAVVASEHVKLMKVKVRGTGDYDEDDIVVIGIDENTPSATS